MYVHSTLRVLRTYTSVLTQLELAPDDFFVGIGDINSAHLPPLTPPPGSAHPPSPVPSSPALSTSSSASSTIAPSDVTQVSPEAEAHAATLAGKKDVQDAVLSRAQSLAIEHVVQDRPLAKMQEALDHEGDADGEVNATITPDAEREDGSATSESEKKEERKDFNGHDTEKPAIEAPRSPKVKHKMLLHNNDNELLRVEEVRITLV